MLCLQVEGGGAVNVCCRNCCTHGPIPLLGSPLNYLILRFTCTLRLIDNSNSFLYELVVTYLLLRGKRGDLKNMLRRWFTSLPLCCTMLSVSELSYFILVSFMKNIMHSVPIIFFMNSKSMDFFFLLNYFYITYYVHFKLVCVLLLSVIACCSRYIGVRICRRTNPGKKVTVFTHRHPILLAVPTVSALLPSG